MHTFGLIHIKFIKNFLFQVTCIIGSFFQNTVNVIHIRMPLANKQSKNARQVFTDT